MSDKSAPKLTKKQLKATAFRAKKKIKDLISPDPIAVPQDDNDDEDDGEVVEKDGKRKMVVHSDKKSIKTSTTIITKKRKNPSPEPDPNQIKNNLDSLTQEDLLLINGPAAKRRKRKKASLIKKKIQDEDQRGVQQNKSKLILFIGNLPFEISVERLKSFFFEHCDEEPTVRLMTPKTSNRSSSSCSTSTKGCGFIEFQTSAALQKALRLHHTPLSLEADPSKENQKKARKINIELTAGGGGNSDSRQKKIGESQARLAKQREKRLEKTIKEATEKKIKSGLVDPEGDVSIKLGSKKKVLSGLEDGKADWGLKAKDHPGKPTTTRSKEKWRPQSSGANSIRLG